MSDAAPSGIPEAIAGLRAPANLLDPRVRALWMVQSVIGVAVAGVVAGGVLLAVHAGVDAGLPPYAWLIWGVAVTAGVIGAVVLPGLSYPWHRWEVTPLGLFVQRGWVWRTWTIVPHSRIQAVDTTSGPLERRYELATVHARTASSQGSGKVPGLSAALADQLTRELATHAGVDEAT